MSFAIHNIDVKKPKTDEELSFIQKLFNDKISPKIKEMANKYRLQQLPKTKFIGGSMKTIKQGKHIRIKYGTLKDDCQHLLPNMEGKGLFDFIKSKAKDLYSGLKSGVSKVFSTRLDDYNNTSKETLQKYGDMNIDNLVIYRTPINSMIDKALNVFSLGKFAEMKKKYGFDEFFHLALVAEVKGKNVIIEKNEVINVSTSYKTNDKTETMKVDMKGKPLTINQLMNATREKQKPEDYFSYDAFNNNCQMFIRALLTNVGLYTKEIDVFLFQNVENLIKEMPTLAKVAKTATDIGAWFNKLTGKGKGETPLKTPLVVGVEGAKPLGVEGVEPLTLKSNKSMKVIMKGLGNLNRLFNGEGSGYLADLFRKVYGDKKLTDIKNVGSGMSKASGFIRVLMANRNKKGNRRRNRKGQILPKFDLDRDYLASLNIIKENLKNTKHKKYFDDIAKLEDLEEKKKKGYNTQKSYYEIDHEQRNEYSKKLKRDAGARWREANREKERERGRINRAKKKEARRGVEEEKKEEGSGKGETPLKTPSVKRRAKKSGKKPALVDNIVMSIKEREV